MFPSQNRCMGNEKGGNVCIILSLRKSALGMVSLHHINYISSFVSTQADPLLRKIAIIYRLSHGDRPLEISAPSRERAI